MRVAVCLSGYVRGMDACIPTWQKHLLSNHHQFDFFFCAGPTTEWINTVGIDPYLQKLRMNFNLINVSIAQPVSAPYPKILEDRNFNSRNLEHFLSMFDKIKQSNQLKSNHETLHNFKYDCVIRLRPDVFLRTNVESLVEVSKWNVPKHGDFGGINDQFAWSSSENMDYYCSLYDNIIKYLEEDKSLTVNPEYLLKRHWEKANVPLIRPNILYNLARTNSDFLPDNETRERLQRESNGTRNL